MSTNNQIKTAKEKLDPRAEVRSRGKVVFPAESPKVKDKKDHFPINNAAQARNALARAGQYDKVPPWYKGTLSELKNAVQRAVHKHYKSIEISDKKADNYLDNIIKIADKKAKEMLKSQMPSKDKEKSDKPSSVKKHKNIDIKTDNLNELGKYNIQDFIQDVLKEESDEEHEYGDLKNVNLEELLDKVYEDVEHHDKKPTKKILVLR